MMGLSENIGMNCSLGSPRFDMAEIRNGFIRLVRSLKFNPDWLTSKRIEPPAFILRLRVVYLRDRSWNKPRNVCNTATVRGSSAQAQHHIQDANQENEMTLHRMLYGPLLAVALLPACVVAPAHGPYVVAPALPVMVELDVVPYFYGGFYYTYHPRDQHWRYSRSRTGPWIELPRDRYPREIRYKDRDRDRDRDYR
jgi:hypothetical protein